ncbi:LacI family DNA-binding transcriptional regulator [Azospirillum sp.]|uniref:LacI family DNA-binding transcriptional regulator n=1 Tax=Azospirillum sp. TaxID=34012 RepID=UPI002D3F9A18|nr:LacI family DNA-binding transcriptional regulator [Azospirillum sp.]HYD71181.1 LacI family DNA-binding transcriptional regulator [Azospirillum sp.]
MSSSSPVPPKKAARKDPPPKPREGARTSSRSSGSVTLEDVAKLAGVAPITVSRVLNRPELVTQETLEHVRSVIARTGYVPNLLAGGLASKRSRLVAAIVPTIGDSVFAEAVEALTDRLDEAGYKVLLGLSGYPATREDDLIAAVLSRRPDAIFLTGITHSAETRQRLLASRVPVVETWDMTPTPLDMLVGFSHEKVGRAVGEYLCKKGYRRFGLVWAGGERAAVRRKGLAAALAEHGVADLPAAVVQAPGNLKIGREGLTQLLESGPCPEVVVCSSDALAHGVLTEAKARGLTIPGDLAVMGFGDLEFAPYTYPALSTVRIDRRGIGLRAAEAMLARFDGKPVESVVDIGFEVIEREST